MNAWGLAYRENFVLSWAVRFNKLGLGFSINSSLPFSLWDISRYGLCSVITKSPVSICANLTLPHVYIFVIVIYDPHPSRHKLRLPLPPLLSLLPLNLPSTLTTYQLFYRHSHLYHYHSPISLCSSQVYYCTNMFGINTPDIYSNFICICAGTTVQCFYQPQYLNGAQVYSPVMENHIVVKSPCSAI